MVKVRIYGRNATWQRQICQKLGIESWQGTMDQIANLVQRHSLIPCDIGIDPLRFLQFRNNYS